MVYASAGCVEGSPNPQRVPPAVPTGDCCSHAHPGGGSRQRRATVHCLPQGKDATRPSVLCEHAGDCSFLVCVPRDPPPPRARTLTHTTLLTLLSNPSPRHTLLPAPSPSHSLPEPRPMPLVAPSSVSRLAGVVSRHLRICSPCALCVRVSMGGVLFSSMFRLPSPFACVCAPLGFIRAVASHDVSSHPLPGSVPGYEGQVCGLQRVMLLAWLS